jgi:hypothetical protein
MPSSTPIFFWGGGGVNPYASHPDGRYMWPGHYIDIVFAISDIHIWPLDFANQCPFCHIVRSLLQRCDSHHYFCARLREVGLSYSASGTHILG